MPSAWCLRGPSGKFVVIRARVLGAMRAAPTPCSARAASSQALSVASPPSREEPAKSRTPAVRVRRRPMMSPTRPPSSSRPPKASV